MDDQQLEPAESGLDVAIIAMAGRFPGAPDLERFWANLRDGVEAISFSDDAALLAAGVDPALLRDPNYVRAGARLDGADLFDAGFFGLYPREAELLDPQQRLFLEVAWEALERAGYDPERYAGPIGVFAGAGMNTYLLRNLLNSPLVRETVQEYQISIVSDKDYLPTRVSYKLNLRGPSVNVQTACSTSLVAVHMACQSLLSYQADMALAGGVAVRAPQEHGYAYQEGSILAPDGHCRPFDAAAKGTVPGNGVGIVVLKRLADAVADGDTVLAVIKATAINNDGAAKVGYTAPSVDGQAEVIAAAQAIAGIDPATIGYVEAHGTGTALGDPIEITALNQVFAPYELPPQSIAIGSLKSNVGHMDAAAGVGALIKTVLSLQHGQIPPSLHYREPNPQIPFASSPFYVNSKLRDWPADRPRLAGVSSFGIGGTNAHAIVAAAPEPEPGDAGRAQQLLLLSAKTETALAAAAANLAAHLRAHPEQPLADVAYTLQLGRQQFAQRMAVVASSHEEAAAALESGEGRRAPSGAADGERPVAFLFTGQGAQYPGMARALYEAEPRFRDEVDRCAAILQPQLGRDIRALIFGAAEGNALGETRYTQPALFTVEYALAQLLIGGGVTPRAMIGHSIGEYVAACLAGVFSLEDALGLVAARGRLMWEMPRGTMLSVQLGEAALLPLLPPGVELAAVNAPELCVAAGGEAGIAALEQRLAADGVGHRRLHTSHAFHSALMDAAVAPFAALVERTARQAPHTPFVSNRTGRWITAEEATDARYWALQMREAVRFADGLGTLFADGEWAVVEVGPGQSLATFARQHPLGRAQRVIATLPGPQDATPADAALLGALGRLWVAGAPVDWPALWGEERRRRVPLPTYPFERQRYWIESVPFAAQGQRGQLRKGADVADWFYTPAWRQAPLRRDRQAAGPDGARWLVFSECNVGTSLARGLAEQGADVVTVQIGAGLQRLDARSFTLDPDDGASYDALLEAVAQDGAPTQIVHAWSLAEQAPPLRGLASLLALVQALARRGDGDLQLTVLTRDAQDVLGDEPGDPYAAAIHGLCRSVPQELPGLRCRTIDLRSAEQDDPRLIAQLLAELRADADERQLAYRGGRRWAEQFAPVRLEPVERPELLRAGGVYLVTGGLGRVGLALAGELARAGASGLALVGRTALPAREAWPAHLAAHDAGDRTARAIRGLLALEEQGVELLLLRADAGSYDELASAMAATRSRFGALHGVIHAAGFVGPDSLRTLADTDAAHLDAHMRAKAEGALALERLAAEERLELVVLVSSLAAVAGGVGMGAYAAANSFLDAVARRQRGGATTWLSINWEGWAFGDEPQGALRLALTPDEGADAFRRALGYDLGPQLLVSTADLAARLAQGGRREAAPATTLHARPELRTSYSEPQSELEQAIVALWQQVLGIERIGAHDDFFELGGHSLLATQVVSRLRDSYGVELPLRDLFERPTVSGLAALIAAARDGASEPALPAIAALPRDGELPLSYAQERMWFLDQLEPGSPLYNNPAAVRLHGSLDVAALERALAAIVARHEVLRTTFREQDGRAVPLVTPPEAASALAAITMADLRGLPAPERDAELRRLAAAEAQAPFDLAAGPLLRLRLLRLADDEHVALLTMHHVVSDGWSLGVFIRELGALYAAFVAGQASPLPPLAVQYADVAAWQKAALDARGADGASRAEAQLAYWRAALSDELPALELPTDRPRPQMQSFRGGTRWFQLPRALMDGVAELCRREEVTPFMALLAAFEAVLYRYTGQPAFGVGTPIAGRTRAEAEPLIGFFVNTLVLRADVDGAMPFRELLRQVRERSLGAYAHQELPFESLVDALQPERSLSHTPLFQVMFVLQNAPMQQIALPGVTMQPLEVDSGTAKFDITLSVEERADGYGGWLNYNADLFDDATMERLLGHFATLLAGACADAGRPIAGLPLLTAAEERQILVEWNATATDDAPATLVHLAFAARAAAQPDAIAVAGDRLDAQGAPAELLSYGELERRANQLAQQLRRLGVGPERLVGLCVERSPQMLVGLLGIWKAGGAYLPLDPGYPAERLRFMVEDARPAVLLASGRGAEAVTALGALPAGTELLRLDADWERIAAEPEEAPAVEVAPEGMAYVIYTSGSTGTPKGVVIEHRAFGDHCRDMARFYGLTPEDRVLQFASFSFDASLEQLVPPLLAGARLVLRGDEVWSVDAFARQLDAHGLTVINPPTAYWHALIAEWAASPHADRPTQLRLVIVGGDALRPESLELRARTSLGAPLLLNAYGPTETTITATTWAVPATWPAELRRAPIGRPLANRRAFLLDQFGNPVPVGVPGELYLGGLGVARGYLNRDELTAERFIPDPFSPRPPAPPSPRPAGPRLYRTGDLARYLPDGTIDYLGRVDSQVKIRGFRIELGEIEAALAAQPGVREALVLARADASGERGLVAYVVWEPGAAGDLAGLRGALAAQLPDYMLPAAFVALEAFPLTPSGKVDRRALPQPDLARSVAAAGYVAPRNAVEELIAAAWAEVLGAERVGIDDNFFELGGHSLLATRLVSRLRSSFNVELPLRRLFETPTVAGVAIAIAQAQAEQTADDELQALLAELEGLSEEEAAQLLAAEADEQEG